MKKISIQRQFVICVFFTAPWAFAATATAQTAASDFTYATRYDLERRVTGTIAPDPDGSGPIKYPASRFSYDVDGRLLSIEQGELSDWQGQDKKPSEWTGFTALTRKDMVYDAANHKIRESVTSGTVVTQVTQYSYDANGRLECTAVRMNPAAFASLPASACTLATSGSYGPDRITRNLYDTTGRLVQIRKGVGTALEQAYATYSYTPNDKREYIVDANGNKAQLVYDGFDRVSQWQFPSPALPTSFDASTADNALATSGAVSTTDFEAFGYDANGNRTSVRKRDGRTINFSFDALNRMSSKLVPDSACPASNPDICTNVPLSATRDVYYKYDLAGAQTEARFDSAAGADSVVNQYDGFGQITSSTVSMNGVSRAIQHRYDAGGNRTETSWPDAQKVTFDHDGLDRLNWAYEGGTTVLLQYGYTVLGQPWFLSRASGLNTVDYYDSAQRLSALAHDFNGTAADLTYGFSDYNPANQVVTESRDNIAYAFGSYTPVNRTYVSNGLNQYTSSGTTSLGYDANGDLRYSGTTAFLYDAENRLVGTAIGGSAQATLIYDPLGRLYEIQLGVTRRQFLYDGDELVAEYDGNSGAMTARYVHGMRTDDPVIWYDGPTVSASARKFLHADRQGSIIAISDASGNKLSINSYDEYGIPAASNTGLFQYTGQIWLGDIGIYYYKARLYSPTLGRFLQTDPVGYNDQMNLYTYVGNDPVNRTDPTGTEECAPAQPCPQSNDPLMNGTNGDGTIKDVAKHPLTQNPFPPTKEQVQTGAETSYYETRGLTAQRTADGKEDPASAKRLDDARRQIAQIAVKRNDMRGLNGSGATNPAEKKAWRESVDAAENMTDTPITKDTTGFFIRNPDKPGNAQSFGNMGHVDVIRSYGPFVSAGGGDAGKGNRIYILITVPQPGYH